MFFTLQSNIWGRYCPHQLGYLYQHVLQAVVILVVFLEVSLLEDAFAGNTCEEACFGFVERVQTLLLLLSPIKTWLLQATYDAYWLKKLYM